MPSFDEVVRYFSGALLLMSGKSEGMRRLDLSADGFWRSFSAIIVALPPIALSWIEFEAIERVRPVVGAGAVTIYTAHALADIVGWLLPILILMLAAKRIGYSKKIVPLVVATNWGGAFLAWAFAPYWLLVLMLGASDGTALLGVLVGLASIGLMVRLIYVAMGKDIGGAFAITALMVVCSLVSYGAVMDLTGVPLV